MITSHTAIPSQQDLDHLLRRDVENSGLELEEKNKGAEKLLAKAGDDESRKIRTRAGDSVAVATVKDAQALKHKVIERQTKVSWMRVGVLLFQSHGQSRS